MSTSTDRAALPIISLADHQDIQSLSKVLGDSCTKEGFIYLSSHGIPQDLIDNAFAVASDYFAQAQPEDKVDLQDNLGYTAILDPSKPGQGDLKECFHFADPEWDQENGKSQSLPASLVESRSTIDTFIKQINRVASLVLRALSLALGLPEDFLVKQHHGQHNRLRMLHYPPVELKDDTGQENGADIRAGAHTDYGSITLLFQHKVSGLQVSRAGSWVDVAPRDGCLVINIGDTLEFWSAGKFKSTLHRVVMPRNAAETQSRYSIAYFVHPDTNSVVEPYVDGSNEAMLDELLRQKGMPTGIRRIGGNDYVKARLHASYAKSVKA